MLDPLCGMQCQSHSDKDNSYKKIIYGKIDGRWVATDSNIQSRRTVLNTLLKSSFRRAWNNNNNIALWSGMTNAVLQVSGPL